MLGIRKEVLKIITVKWFGVLQIFHFVRKIILLIVPRMISLLVRLQVRVAVTNFVCFFHTWLVPFVSWFSEVFFPRFIIPLIEHFRLSEGKALVKLWVWGWYHAQIWDQSLWMLVIMLLWMVLVMQSHVFHLLNSDPSLYCWIVIVIWYIVKIRGLVY